MEITPHRDPFILLLARWLFNGLIFIIKFCFWGIVLSAAITVFVFAARIIWFFIQLILNAVGGF
jgi:hypothetical protein